MFNRGRKTANRKRLPKNKNATNDIKDTSTTSATIDKTIIAVNYIHIPNLILNPNVNVIPIIVDFIKKIHYSNTAATAATLDNMCLPLLINLKTLLLMSPHISEILPLCYTDVLEHYMIKQNWMYLFMNPNSAMFFKTYWHILKPQLFEMYINDYFMFNKFTPSRYSNEDPTEQLKQVFYNSTFYEYYEFINSIKNVQTNDDITNFLKTVINNVNSINDLKNFININYNFTKYNYCKLDLLLLFTNPAINSDILIDIIDLHKEYEINLNSSLIAGHPNLCKYVAKNWNTFIKDEAFYQALFENPNARYIILKHIEAIIAYHNAIKDIQIRWDILSKNINGICLLQAGKYHSNIITKYICNNNCLEATGYLTEYLYSSTSTDKISLETLYNVGHNPHILNVITSDYIYKPIKVDFDTSNCGFIQINSSVSQIYPVLNWEYLAENEQIQYILNKFDIIKRLSNPSVTTTESDNLTEEQKIHNSNADEIVRKINKSYIHKNKNPFIYVIDAVVYKKYANADASASASAEEVIFNGINDPQTIDISSYIINCINSNKNCTSIYVVNTDVILNNREGLNNKILYLKNVLINEQLQKLRTYLETLSIQFGFDQTASASASASSNFVENTYDEKINTIIEQFELYNSNVSIYRDTIFKELNKSIPKIVDFKIKTLSYTNKLKDLNYSYNILLQIINANDVTVNAKNELEKAKIAFDNAKDANTDPNYMLDENNAFRKATLQKKKAEENVCKCEHDEKILMNKHTWAGLTPLDVLNNATYYKSQIDTLNEEKYTCVGSMETEINNVLDTIIPLVAIPNIQNIDHNSFNLYNLIYNNNTAYLNILLYINKHVCETVDAGNSISKYIIINDIINAPDAFKSHPDILYNGFYFNLLKNIHAGEFIRDNWEFLYKHLNMEHTYPIYMCALCQNSSPFLSNIFEKLYNDPTKRHLLQFKALSRNSLMNFSSMSDCNVASASASYIPNTFVDSFNIYMTQVTSIIKNEKIKIPTIKLQSKYFYTYYVGLDNYLYSENGNRLNTLINTTINNIISYKSLTYDEPDYSINISYNVLCENEDLNPQEHDCNNAITILNKELYTADNLYTIDNVEYNTNKNLITEYLKLSLYDTNKLLNIYYFDYIQHLYSIKHKMPFILNKALEITIMSNKNFIKFKHYSPTESNIGKSPLSCDARVHHRGRVDLNPNDLMDIVDE